MPHPDQPKPKRAIPEPRRRTPAWVPVAVGVAVTIIVVLAVVFSSLRTGPATNEAERRLIPHRQKSSAPAVQPGRGVVAAVAPNTPSAKPLAASVANRVKAAGAAPGVLGADIMDAVTGETLYQSGQSTLLTPASNLKVMTAVALLDCTDAGHRYTTKVVADGSALTLVGGGDPYLRSSVSDKRPEYPSTEQLAKRTAAALKKAGTKSVTVRFDDTLFSGPTWNSAWPIDNYSDEVTPITSLWVDEGMINNNPWNRSKTPAVLATNTFVGQLRSAGIKVTGSVARHKAAESDKQIAAVQSIPVEDLVTRTLEESDNSAAEVLSRQMALASGKPGSFAGASQALEEHLKNMGAWQDGAVVQDGSGLSRGNRITASMLSHAWRKVLTTSKLQPVANAVPVSRVSGTLHKRFSEPSTAAARGVVHAKTGSLQGVISMSGWLRDADGRILVTSFIVNQTDGSARSWLDVVYGNLAGCGCTR
ncbi:D-alanyl-D-alanine carboxypeptidase/D-alanyl-D-alanine endopeptidase [Cutibacterium avidum]|uniref:D-alanyl-D-alanine carboxypeptidase/D-alanyl-D-alanine endopeptidase n=1 Tax=Cutibacterium avidum TaxID=33010 RepID=UPI0008100736|nr:D-alanyl-D-alanine carboxypeptidase/D-alanyl-D-alanine-endopeptidase [Cutibacterium avidum]OCK13530.1 D-alanyl-D-alanine carboxypeptidase/D-alanyl-D-alanine-endopeptidase [Cutibacterium avidum]